MFSNLLQGETLYPGRGSEHYHELSITSQLVDCNFLTQLQFKDIY